MKFVGLTILGLVTLWFSVGAILRLGGLAAAFLALFSLASGGVGELPAGRPYAVTWLSLGALMWLAGHWHFACRHGHPKSSLADRLFVALPGWLDPLQRYRPSRATYAEVQLQHARTRARPLEPPMVANQHRRSPVQLAGRRPAIRGESGRGRGRRDS